MLVRRLLVGADNEIFYIPKRNAVKHVLFFPVHLAPFNHINATGRYTKCRKGNGEVIFTRNVLIVLRSRDAFPWKDYSLEKTAQLLSSRIDNANIFLIRFENTVS
jgi:hypothetical protein